MQLANVVEPFGEVNVYKQTNGNLNIVATILIEPVLEHVKMGLALDGSASMKTMYGSGVGIFKPDNTVQPVARTMVGYLANFSYPTGKVDVIYWACSPDGSQIEEIGEFDAESIQKIALAGPKKLPWGRGTKLLPPLQHFVKKFQQGAKTLGLVKEPCGFCVFITDGIIEDFPEVKKYCLNYAQEISQGKKPFVKLFLLGVGEEIDQGQMDELDDLDTGCKDTAGVDIDFWDHQLASDMKQLEQVFKELVSEDVIVVGSGRIVNQASQTCQEYADGVPALLKFTLPSGSTAFTLETPQGSFTQDISEAL